jgi:hypothetical protein
LSHRLLVLKLELGACFLPAFLFALQTAAVFSGVFAFIFAVLSGYYSLWDLAKPLDMVIFIASLLYAHHFS